MSEEITTITGITDVTKEAIRQKSVQALPNRPSESGYKASDIKAAIASPMLNGAISLVGEINRIVAAINSRFATQDEAIENACQCDHTNALCHILTEAPTEANASGHFDIVLLNAEPSNKYDGYIYIINS